MMASAVVPLTSFVFLVLAITTATGTETVSYDVCPLKPCYWEPEAATLNCKLAGCTEFPQIDSKHGEALHLIFQRNNIANLSSLHRLVPLFNSLQTLDLSYNDILKVPPGSFKGIGQIEKLDLSNNHITAFENSPLKGTVVKKLVLSNNRLDVIQTSALHDDPFPNMDLQELEMDDNQIMFIEKDALKMPFLKKLSLANNDLVVLGNLKELGQLKELNLHGNQIQTLANTGVFQNMISLEKLDLSRNDITQIEAMALDGLSSLRSLILDWNKLTNLDDSLVNLRRLEALSLSNNNFNMIGPSTVKFPSRIRNLTIESCSKIRRIDDQAFQDLENLENVEINCNPSLAGISHNAFEGASNLLRLSLRDNALMMIDSTLVPWRGLQELDLSGNHWHCDCHLAWVLRVADFMPARSEERMICSSPSSLAGVAVSSMSINDMTCPHAMNRHTRIEIGLFILATAALMVILTLILIRFRYAFFPCCRGDVSKYSALYNADVDGSHQADVNLKPDLEQRDMIAKQRHVTEARPPDVV